MKVYRISYRGVGVVNEEHVGYTYVSSKREAEKLASESKTSDYHAEEIVSFKVSISKRGLLWALNNYGGHPDNG